MAGQTDHPHVRIPPPAIFVAFFLLGLLIPIDPRAGVGLRASGIALVTMGLALIGWGIGEMTRARTEILPHRPAAALVRSGPFRYTRNPLYLGMLTAYTGGALVLGMTGPLLLLPLALAVLHRFVIRREEEYLERRFGEEYRGYKRSVRRWI